MVEVKMLYNYVKEGKSYRTSDANLEEVAPV